MTDVRAMGEYVEVVTLQVPPRRLNTLYVEATTFTSSAPRVVNGFFVEAIGITTAPRNIGAMYVEVLTPSKLVFPFKGWGAPI